MVMFKNVSKKFDANLFSTIGNRLITWERSLATEAIKLFPERLNYNKN